MIFVSIYMLPLEQTLLSRKYWYSVTNPEDENFTFKVYKMLELYIYY